MKKINGKNVKEFIGLYILPALFILLMVAFCHRKPEHWAAIVFQYSGVFAVLWYTVTEFMEKIAGDFVNTWMSRMNPFINLFLIVVYFSCLTFITLLCMLHFNRYVLLAVVAVGCYLPLTFFWMLFSFPHLKADSLEDKSVDLDKTPTHPTGPSFSPDTPYTRILCRNCGIPVSNWLREPDLGLKNWLFNEKYNDGEPLVPQGVFLEVEQFLERDECFWGAEKSRVILNLDDLVNSRVGGIRHGCCGVDGGDDINIFCKNGHPIGTEVSDCYQPEFVHMASENIVTESKSPEDLDRVNTSEEIQKIIVQPKRGKSKKSISPERGHAGFDQGKIWKIEAEFLRIALIAGVIGIDEVVKWADRVIEKDREDDIFLELALCTEQSLGKVAELLGTVPGNCELALPVNILLAYCHLLLEEGKMEPDAVLVKLSRLSAVNKVPEPFRSDFDWLGELDYLADNEGQASSAQVRHEVRQYLASYAKYHRWIPLR